MQADGRLSCEVQLGDSCEFPHPSTRSKSSKEPKTNTESHQERELQSPHLPAIPRPPTPPMSRSNENAKLS